jgi:hypothetical protein
MKEPLTFNLIKNGGKFKEKFPNDKENAPNDQEHILKPNMTFKIENLPDDLFFMDQNTKFMN